jgi:hypothetical protein
MLPEMIKYSFLGNTLPVYSSSVLKKEIAEEDRDSE